MTEVLTHSIPAFVLVLGVIIFFHEFGHFITAKSFGIKVFIFSFGFGKRLFGFKWGGTDCRVSLVPLGGYVKLEGEPDDRLSEDGPSDVRVLEDGTLVRVQSPDYFLNRPRWQRFLVYLAGPFMNGVLTVSAFTLIFMIGWGVDATLSERPVIGVVESGSPAAQAGLRPGDEISAIDGRPTPTWEEAQIGVLLRPDRAIAIELRRDGQPLEVSVHSLVSEQQKVGSIGIVPLVRIGQVVPGQPAEAAGLHVDDGILDIDGKPIRSFEDVVRAVGGSKQALAIGIWRDGRRFDMSVAPRDGRIGIANKTVFRKFGLLAAVRESFRETWRQTRQTFVMLGQLLTARISAKAGLTGPVGIAKLSGDAARSGPVALLYVVAAISLSVGILNLFPLAPLDGGHLAILAAEGVARRNFSVTLKAWIMNAGVVVLFALIGLVLYSDLSKTSLLGKYLP